MIGLFGLFADYRMGPPTAMEFTWFYSIKGNKNDEGLYYFAERPLKGLQAITKIKESLGPLERVVLLHSGGPNLRHLRQGM